MWTFVSAGAKAQIMERYDPLTERRVHRHNTADEGTGKSSLTQARDAILQLFLVISVTFTKNPLQIWFLSLHFFFCLTTFY